MPASRQDLLERLVELGIESRTVDHQAVYTVEESRAIHKHELLPGGHSKNLFLKDKKGAIILIVALNDADINLKTLHKMIDSGRLSFGKPDLLLDVLGVTPGSVTPFALINDKNVQVQVVLDQAMMAYDVLNFHPLDNAATTNIAKADLLKFIRSCGHDPRIIAVSGDVGGDPAN